MMSFRIQANNEEATVDRNDRYAGKNQEPKSSSIEKEGSMAREDDIDWESSKDYNSLKAGLRYQYRSIRISRWSKAIGQGNRRCHHVRIGTGLDRARMGRVYRAKGGCS